MRAFVLCFVAIVAVLASPTVRLPGGRVYRGSSHMHESGTEVYSFLSIPFALPPVGDLRFAPPQAIDDSDDGVEHDAQTPSPACMQTPNLFTGIPGTVISEDCLYLNVYAPNTNSTDLLPVMFFIYGGAFIQGWAGFPYYNGTNIAGLTGDTVVVTVNYRVGVFGFLAHPLLAAESNTTGNWGMLDQILGMQWVQDNIAAFGGDPDQVTIFGESAGGISVCAQMASPLADGLFAQGIMEDGSCQLAQFLPQAYAQGDELVDAAGCSDSIDILACLRRLNATNLLYALPNRPVGGYVGAFYSPVIDSFFLFDLPQVVLESGDRPSRPTMAGTCWHGATLFVMLNMTLLEMNDTVYDTMVHGFFDLSGDLNLANQVLAEYSPSNYPVVPYAESYAAILSDYIFSCPTRHSLRTIAAGDAPAYQYSFVFHPQCSEMPAQLLPLLGSYHFADIPYVFDVVPNPECTFSDEEVQLSMNIIQYFTNFAHSGNPNMDANPDRRMIGNVISWPAINSTSADSSTLLFNSTLSVTPTYSDDTFCDFWDTVYPNLKTKF